MKERFIAWEPSPRSILSELVETAITRHLDIEKFQKVAAVEKKHRKLIEAAGAKLELAHDP